MKPIVCLAATAFALLTVAARAQPIPAPAAEGADPSLIARIETADAAAGAALAAQCGICHTLAAGQPARVGPNLYGIVGARIAASPAFTYSPALQALGASGATWTFARLDAFIADPASAVTGTRMGFAGLANDQDRANVIAYLRTLAVEPALLRPAETPINQNPPLFTALQADQGRTSFDREGCGNCHGPTGRGGPDGSQLVGPDFAAKWSGRTMWELFQLTRRTMPPDARGGLENERYAQILAYVLSANGYAAGDTLLPAVRAPLEAMRLN